MTTQPRPKSIPRQRLIELALEALRAVDRYGITRSAEQYAGWRQIGSGPSGPSPATSREEAALVLAKAAYPQGHNAAIIAGLLDDPGVVAVIARRARRFTHPDLGGSAEAFHEVQRATATLTGDSQ